MCVLAGISVLAAIAGATPVDARIMIDRALNSPTLTVRYDGANAALVELRVNGESLGTRSVSSNKASGETNFTLNLTELKDGDNEVEVRLFDRTGKLVGSDKSNISTDQSNYGPVFLKTPKVGATVMGAIDVNMGFGRDLKNVHVSFFVDSNFKKMTNYPPYNMIWDTALESNGWHEIEAWAIDESSTTFKTRKTRVFVNNPGGRTDRDGVVTEGTVTPNPMHAELAGGATAKVRNMTVKANAKASGAADHSVAPSISSGNTISAPLHTLTVGEASGFKPAPVGSPSATGPRTMAPNTGRVAVVANHLVKSTGEISITPHGQVGSALRNTVAATNMVSITKGQRLPNLTNFSVILNSAIVEFPDAQPRVDNGVPMTPLRYLLEKDGAKVDWSNMTKTVSAKAEGRDITLQIGDKDAMVNKLKVSMEVAPYIDRGRTIVPLSFLHDALNVDVEYDKETGHVLISSTQK